LAGIPLQVRGDGAVDPAGERDEHPAIQERLRRRGTHGMAERDGERVGGQVSRVELAGGEPAEFLGDGLRIDPGGVEDRLSLGEGDHRAGSRLRGAAAARLEADRSDALAVDGERNTDQITAGSTAGDADVRAIRGDATPGGVMQMLGEPLVSHTVRVRCPARSPARHRLRATWS
jgi:hypothetical protein